MYTKRVKKKRKTKRGKDRYQRMTKKQSNNYKESGLFFNAGRKSYHYK